MAAAVNDNVSDSLTSEVPSADVRTRANQEDTHGKNRSQPGVVHHARRDVGEHAPTHDRDRALRRKSRAVAPERLVEQRNHPWAPTTDEAQVDVTHSVGESADATAGHRHDANRSEHAEGSGPPEGGGTARDGSTGSAQAVEKLPPLPSGGRFGGRGGHRVPRGVPQCAPRPSDRDGGEHRDHHVTSNRAAVERVTRRAREDARGSGRWRSPRPARPGGTGVAGKHPARSPRTPNPTRTGPAGCRRSGGCIDTTRSRRSPSTSGARRSRRAPGNGNPMSLLLVGYAATSTCRRVRQLESVARNSA